MALTLAAGSPDYPARLFELPDPPLFLHATGPLPPAERWVAIVGSRRASEGGRALAEQWAGRLAERGVGVVSGGALGIDAAAHRGAIGCGGATIVVLPTPIHRPAPRQNWRLFGDVMASGGALVSEHSSGPDGKSGFMTRNRIIAALADAVLVVEAGPHSGTRYTVRAGRWLGRALGAVPWTEDDPRGTAAASMLARGARAIRNTADLWSWLSLPELHSAATSDPILLALGEEAISIDRLATKARLPIPHLLAGLTRLEMEGRIQRLAGSRVRRC